MIIKPSIRSNFFTNSHPIGIKKMMENYVNEVKTFEPYQGPHNVLIIGGSSGYGLASRLSLAFKGGSNTVNVSFENEPKGNKTGTAGYWNNIFFEHYAKETGRIHKDFNGNAFGDELKQKVLSYVKETFGKLDLIIYSLASGARPNPETGDIVKSQIKPVGQKALGQTIDLKSMEVLDLSLDEASEQDIKDTIFVMGGSDWYDWIDLFDQNDALAKNFKTISYTYIGGPNTDQIYRHGTLGFAKKDLEEKARLLNERLKDKYEGEALVSSSKAIVSKASVFIPKMPIYVSCLFDIMKAHKLHETTLEHKHRLFKDMVYGNLRLVDEENRIRLDHKELDPKVQEEVKRFMDTITGDQIFNLKGTKAFIKEFYNINGFEVDGVDEDQDVDIEALLKTYKTEDYDY
jgi:enoyl-[acyl-carrier protein] reductase/trans-2-enoyl-CoA reductase (NAD+)